MVLPVKERSIETGAGFIKVFASFELKRQTLDTDPLVQL
jgi:hypothetical protein